MSLTENPYAWEDEAIEIADRWGADPEGVLQEMQSWRGSKFMSFAWLLTTCGRRGSEAHIKYNRIRGEIQNALCDIEADPAGSICETKQHVKLEFVETPEVKA